MSKPNYGYEKRQKELKRQEKREEKREQKRQRKLDRASAPPHGPAISESEPRGEATDGP